MENLQKIATPVARLLLGLIFFSSGLGKIGQYEGTQAYMEMMGVPGSLLILVIILEVAGGAAIILGGFARTAAFLLAGFTLLSAILFHFDFADQMQMIMFMKNLSITGGLGLLFVFGAGNFSIDQKFGIKY